MFTYLKCTQKIIMSFFVGWAFVSQLQAMNSVSHEGLDPSQRPQNIKEDIDITFQRIKANQPGWFYNGTPNMGISGIDADDLVKTIIQTAPSSQKDFYLLDIGAGDFSWGRQMAKYLNQQTDIPKDITIHIIGVTGEDYGPFKIETSGNCKLYNISSFKIEDLAGQFNKLNLDFNEKLDLVVSRFTFVHLHDSVGTFVQAYNLLRPKTGFMMMETFPIYFGKDDKSSMFGKNMTEILLMTSSPFLITKGGWEIQFILRRFNDSPLKLPLSYEGTLFSTQISNTNDKEVVYFSKIKSDVPEIKEISPEFRQFYGDKSLYEWLYKHYLPWQKIDTSWHPLLKDDNTPSIEHKNKPARLKEPQNPLIELFYDANESGDVEKVKELIAQGLDIHVIDSDTGRPFLQEALEFTEGDILKLILEQPGIDVNSQNKLGETALFQFVKGADYLEEVKILLNKGAKVNIQDTLGNTPLHRAIQRGGKQITPMVEFLLKQGADPTIKNRNGKTPFELDAVARAPELQKFISR